VLNLVSAKLWWIVGCSLSAFLPGSAPAAQESPPARASPEEVNAPWDDLLSVVRKSPIRADQPNRALQGTRQPDDSPAPEFRPNSVPDHGGLDRSGAVPPAVGAPTEKRKRQRVMEKPSGQSAQFTRPRRETTARVPKIETLRGRERQAPSSASPGGVSAASTQSPRLKRNRTNEPEVSAAVVPDFPRSLLPSSATR
jgi:hypothetical protein